MGTLKVFARDRIPSPERFRRTLRAMANQEIETIYSLYANAPHLVQTGPDPDFSERVRIAEIMVRALVADLRIELTKVTLLRHFETTFQQLDAVLQNEMTLAWELGWKAAGGLKDADYSSHQDTLQALQGVGHIPPIFVTTVNDVEVALVSCWKAWTGFVRTAWRLKPEEPLRAWFADNTDEIISAIHATPAQPDAIRVQTYRDQYDRAWQNALNNISCT